MAWVRNHEAFGSACYQSVMIRLPHSEQGPSEEGPCCWVETNSAQWE